MKKYTLQDYLDAAQDAIANELWGTLEHNIVNRAEMDPHISIREYRILEQYVHNALCALCKEGQR